MDFGRFLNYSDFIENPEAAIEKAQKLMEAELKKKVAEEKSRLEEKLKNQQALVHQETLKLLEQQYNQKYNELRKEAGIDKLEEQVSTLESQVSNLQFQLSKEREKIETLENSIAEHNENQRDAETKTAAIIKNIDNKYGTDIIKTANSQGKILSDNEEYEDLMSIADDERLEKLD
jgi:chromosome segregation ATPase